MITPKEAEALATKHVQEYVNACGCNDLEDVGNALLKLLSVTGQAILPEEKGYFLMQEMSAMLRQQAEQIETERMKLVACGVVAMADTPDSARIAREMHTDYRSASLDDVIRRVDECMALRSEVQALKADAERLDLLESTFFAKRWNGVLDSGSRTTWCIVPGYQHSTHSMVGHTFRAAIDALAAAKE